MAARLTQAAVAESVGVTQPTYHRWEAGSVDIPDAKLAKLAKVLKATKEALLGRHPPIKAAFYDDSAPENLQYYGEIAVHFRGGGESLLLLISEQARSHLFASLRLDSKFITVRDLGNRTVAIRREVISDLYLSGEAYDDYGPEQHEPGVGDHPKSVAKWQRRATIESLKTGPDTKVWQFSFFPRIVAYCGTTPTETFAFLGSAVSSMISQALSAPIKASACRHNVASNGARSESPAPMKWGGRS